MSTQLIKKALVLKFKATDESEINLNILKPMDGLNGTEIKTAMDTIIATGALGDTSQAAAIVSAQYDIRQVEDITLA